MAGEAPYLPLNPLPKANTLVNLVESGSSLPHSLSYIALLVLFQFLKCAELLSIPKHPCKLVHIMWIPLSLNLQASYTSL